MLWEVLAEHSGPLLGRHRRREETRATRHAKRQNADLSHARLSGAPASGAGGYGQTPAMQQGPPQSAVGW